MILNVQGFDIIPVPSNGIVRPLASISQDALNVKKILYKNNIVVDVYECAVSKKLVARMGDEYWFYVTKVADRAKL